MTYLFIWAFAGSAAIGSAKYQVSHSGWHEMGAFSSGTACHEAARLLNIASDKHRCISVDGVLK